MSRFTGAGLTPLEQRLLIDRTMKQIARRSLAVPYGFGSKKAQQSREIADRKKKPSLWLMRAVYYAEYSRREGWWVSATYLAGHSDKQDWAVRVPSTMTTVEQALSWLTPSPVKKALEKGKDVYRQGDIYFVPMKLPHHDLSVLLNSRHRPNWPDDLELATPYALGIYATEIIHPQHPPVILKAGQTYKAIQQKQLHINNTRRGAD